MEAMKLKRKTIGERGNMHAVRVGTVHFSLIILPPEQSLIHLGEAI